MNKILLTIISTIITTCFYYFIENKSNFSKYYIIPIIVVLIVKYGLGDLDKGYKYTYKDLLFLFIRILFSISTIYILDKLL